MTLDFNSKIDWKIFDPRMQPNSLDAYLLEVIYEYYLFQNITDHARVGGLRNPSMLYLIFTKNKDDIMDVEYCPPLGKSEHVVIINTNTIYYRKTHHT